MSTLETHANGQVFFQVDNEMIAKINGKWVTDKGTTFDRNKLHNIINSKSSTKLQERIHLKSIMNRLYKSNYKFN